jgi:hypothetical protein
MKIIVVTALLAVVAVSLAACVTAHSYEPDHRPTYLTVHDAPAASRM